MLKQIVIVKDKNAQIKVFKNYIKIKTIYENRVMGVKNMQALYINKNIKIPNLSNLAKFISIYIIDDDGTIERQIDAKL